MIVARVTGQSRGKLWRTTLAKTAAGSVVRTQLIGSVPLLIVDCAISPQGDLVVFGHTGKPDWGNGPKGDGCIFKISLTDKTAPQPVLTWPASETETVIAFDRPLDPAAWSDSTARWPRRPGTLTLRGQLDLERMLIPATQPMSQLD